MRKLFVFGAFAISLAVAVASCASAPVTSSVAPAAQNHPQITIVNNTGYTFTHLFVSPTTSAVWGDDVLGNQVLASGASFSVTLPYSLTTIDTYDIMAVDTDVDGYIKWNVRVAAGDRIVLTMSDFVGSVQGQTLPQITVVNNTGYPFVRLYVSPTASDVWGNNVLGDRVLPSGSQIAVTLPHPINVTNTYDIMAVDTDGDSYTKWNVTVSPNGRIEFVFGDIDWSW